MNYICRVYFTIANFQWKDIDILTAFDFHDLELAELTNVPLLLDHLTALFDLFSKMLSTNFLKLFMTAKGVLLSVKRLVAYIFEE